MTGLLLGLAGFPGFVRDCDYQAGISKDTVSVKTGPLFTVITVSGIEIYFHRLTGKIDGVGRAELHSRVRDHNSALLEDLKNDPRFAAEYLSVALEDSNEMFLVALRKVAEANRMAKISAVRREVTHLQNCRGDPGLLGVEGAEDVSGRRDPHLEGWQ